MGKLDLKTSHIYVVTSLDWVMLVYLIINVCNILLLTNVLYEPNVCPINLEINKHCHHGVTLNDALVSVGSRSSILISTLVGTNAVIVQFHSVQNGHISLG